MRVYRTLLPVGIALGVGIGFLGSYIYNPQTSESLVALAYERSCQ